tara:strand:+ start:813 stop:1229 length:417 start_codon:yes stop_codon:yes gene_type:complete
MGTPFKMKGSPMQRNFGIGSPLHDEDDKIVQGGTKKTVEVSGGPAPEKGSDKFKRVKSETDAMEGDAKLANLSKEYGGKWKREDRSKTTTDKGTHFTVGSKATFVNTEGKTPKQIAVAQSQAKNKKKREYMAKNTTKN